MALQHGATIADRVAAWKSAPPPVQRACQNALVECTQHSFSCQPSSTDINNEYAAIFDPENGFGVTMDTPVRITTQKWRAITFTASVLIRKRDAAGGGQTTPGMMGLAGARHPARMCKDIPEVKVSVSAAAGTAGATAGHQATSTSRSSSSSSFKHVLDHLKYFWFGNFFFCARMCVTPGQKND